MDALRHGASCSLRRIRTTSPEALPPVRPSPFQRPVPGHGPSARGDFSGPWGNPWGIPGWEAGKDGMRDRDF